MSQVQEGAVRVQPNTGTTTMRIGVSIPIPEPYAARLTRARVEAADPLAHAVPPHITLVPPTDIAAAQLGRVQDHLAQVAAAQRPFIVELAGTGSFRPTSPVVFVQLAAGASGCAALQRVINADVLTQPLRFPYHPHVTIAHQLDDATLDAAAASMRDFDAVFPVVHFSLYEHGEDGVWRDVCDFALTS